MFSVEIEDGTHFFSYRSFFKIRKIKWSYDCLFSCYFVDLENVFVQ